LVEEILESNVIWPIPLSEEIDSRLFGAICKLIADKLMKLV